MRVYSAGKLWRRSQYVEDFEVFAADAQKNLGLGAGISYNAGLPLFAELRKRLA
jgi:hypothetical protein